MNAEGVAKTYESWLPVTRSVDVLDGATLEVRRGEVVGVVLDRLPGVYVMLFAPMLDIFMFQNPLVADALAWTTVLPGHYATALLFDATFTDSVGSGALLAALAYALAVLAAGVGLLYRSSAVE